MEFRDYLRILRRHWKLVFVSFVLATGAAAGLTVSTEATYASTARLFVSTSPSTAAEAYTGGQASAQRLASYADLVEGRSLAQRVIEANNLDLTSDELSKKISAAPVPSTVLLSITVHDSNPSDAQFLAQAVARVFVGYVAELETPPGSTVPIIKASIVDDAALPTSPVSPKPVRNLALGAILGLLIGFVTSVLREVLDSSIKTPQEAAANAGTAVIGSIGFDQTAGKKRVLTDLKGHAPRVEAFRVLRTNLQFVDIDSPSKVFVVTSPLPGEGKSTTATNLAIAMVQAGQRVLLVDGDLRRSGVAKLLGLESHVGLTTALVGGAPLEDTIQVHAASGLSVLVSGAIPPNPAELLQSRAMGDLMRRLRGMFDVILIDTPPLLPVTDAALLSAIADGALIVVRHGRTTRDQLQAARTRLAGVGAKVLGVVLNMVPQKGGTYGYGYGYGYAPRPQKKQKPKDPGHRKSDASSSLNA